MHCQTLMRICRACIAAQWRLLIGCQVSFQLTCSSSPAEASSNWPHQDHALSSTTRCSACLPTR